MRRAATIVLASLVAGLCLATTAAAVPCGATDPKTGEPALANLTLADTSVTAIAYGRDTSPDEDYLLRFKVAGCDMTLTNDDPRPEFDVLPTDGGKQIPLTAVTIVSQKGRHGEVSLRLRTHPSAFKPGSYTGLVEIDAPALASASLTPITLSRSEDSDLKPFGLGALGGAIGFVWFAALKFVTRTRLTIGWGWLPLVAAAATVVGGIAAWRAYQDQGVWTVAENGWNAFTAGLAGATTGTMAAIIPAIWKAPEA
jgi:hypothetical protein